MNIRNHISIYNSAWVKIFIFSLFTFHFSIIKAQNASDTAVRIFQDSSVHRLMRIRSDYARLTHGTFNGYRVQIDFGQDRSEANKVMTDFATKYPDIPTYMSYQQPYFKVNVGDYRTKIEAVKSLNILRKDYPGAFVVKDKINPPVLKPATASKE